MSSSWPPDARQPPGRRGSRHGEHGPSLLVFIGLAWLLSERRRAFPWRAVAAGLALQFLFAGVVLRVPAAQQVLVAANDLVLAFDEATQAGTSFVFATSAAPSRPSSPRGRGISLSSPSQALLLLVISALLPLLICGIAAALRRGLGIGANLFLGMVESPLLIRPYLQRMQRSELFALMATGMATLTWAMLVLYASIIDAVLKDIQR